MQDRQQHCTAMRRLMLRQAWQTWQQSPLDAVGRRTRRPAGTPYPVALCSTWTVALSFAVMVSPTAHSHTDILPVVLTASTLKLLLLAAGEEAGAVSSWVGVCSMDSRAAGGLLFLVALPETFQTATCRSEGLLDRAKRPSGLKANAPTGVCSSPAPKSDNANSCGEPKAAVPSGASDD